MHGARVWRMFVCAMQSEANPIIEHYAMNHLNASTQKYFKDINSKLLPYSFSKICDKINVYLNPDCKIGLIVTGIGKVNASAAMFYGCSVFNPKEVVNIGMCGSLKSIHRISNVVNIKKVFQYDAYIPFEDKEFSMIMDHIEIDPTGVYTLNKDIDYEYNHVVLATGDSFIEEQDEKQKLSEIADVVDMEGYAIARICQVFETKLKMFKVVSDDSSKNSKFQFMEFNNDLYVVIVKKLLERLF